ncbi:MAG: hypothetical protein JNM56_04465 [Planctomycetia bacterium]|nr:hypothetical protein [Planctomycetia bacterium]
MRLTGHLLLAVVLCVQPVVLQAQNNAVTATSPTGKMLAVGDKDTIRLVDAATQKDVAAMKAHIGAVTALAFSPDGKLLASGGDDKTICLWSADTGKQLRKFAGHQAGIAAVSFSADGATLTTRDNNQKTHVWELATGKQLQ